VTDLAGVGELPSQAIRLYLEKTATEDAGTALSYPALDECARRLAALLRARESAI
jgi:hypothetical protein